MPPVPSIQKRHQHHTAHSPYEWKERREFSHNWKAKFRGNARVITTDLAWTNLITPPNPKVTTTLEQGLELSKHLTLLQGIPKDGGKDGLDIQPVTVFNSADKDPEQLLVYMRGGLSLPDRNKDLCRLMAGAIEQYTELAPPPKPSSDKRHEMEQARKAEREGKKWGVYHLGLWHATGQTNSPPTICSDMRRTGNGFGATLALYKKMAPLAQTIGRLFQEIDPRAYEQYRQNYLRECAATPELEVFKFSNRSCWHCLAILINAQVGPHKDNHDVLDGWVAMACFGEFEGGELCLPALGYKIPFQPGDVVLFRSAVLEHWIAPFEGTRYSCVFFTKQSNWQPGEEE
ncbi:hypothetical protein GMDG_08570 [Pseudogymnoascus destructans 20631-21]|uniref:2OGFeDO JBP1/TET oxygenase domain-containing protein n=1 Tax=Pseudogymnoascus destructans (strain ATCC MYA-4855 / 20631-21) TaxID=658429 RepID=L8G451_PSED2|nr:hypothetical protein GMDG_08570 [Pseudogymnoascus destructans 20631-21]